MDIIGLKLSYLLAAYAMVVLAVISVQYCCLRKSMAFIIAWEGLAGMVGFGLSATYYSLTAMPLAKLIALGGLGLLVGSLSSLLLYHLPPAPLSTQATRPGQTPPAHRPHNCHDLPIPRGWMEPGLAFDPGDPDWTMVISP